MQKYSLTEHGRDILLLIFTILGILGLVGRGIFLGVSGSIPLPAVSPVDLSASLLDVISMVFCAGLLVPLLVNCIRKLKGREIPGVKIKPIKFLHLAELTALWIVIIVVSSILTSQFQFGSLIAAPLFVLGISIPIIVFAWIAGGGLIQTSRRRLWAVFGIGLAGSTVAALVLEYLALGIGAMTAWMVAAFNPDLRAIFQQVITKVKAGGDIQTLLTSLAPFLTNPWALVLALLFASVIAPIIEETVKPLAVWLLGKNLHSPAEGFALGALCGAGFAMLEGIQAAAGMSQILGVGIAARATSSLMHITASGLMGWGIASFWLEKRYWRLAGTFLLSTGLHGLWNGSVVLAVFGGLRLSLQTGQPDLPGMLLVGMGVSLLGLMLVFILILLPLINNRLRAYFGSPSKPPQSDIIAPLQP